MENICCAFNVIRLPHASGEGLQGVDPIKIGSLTDFQFGESDNPAQGVSAIKLLVPTSLTKRKLYGFMEFTGNGYVLGRVQFYLANALVSSLRFEEMHCPAGGTTLGRAAVSPFTYVPYKNVIPSAPNAGTYSHIAFAQDTLRLTFDCDGANASSDRFLLPLTIFAEVDTIALDINTISSGGVGTLTCFLACLSQ